MVDHRGRGGPLDSTGWWKYMEKQADDHLSVKPLGYVGDSRQPNFVGNAAVQPNHHILDHPGRPTSADQKANTSLPVSMAGGPLTRLHRSDHGLWILTRHRATHGADTR